MPMAIALAISSAAEPANKPDPRSFPANLRPCAFKQVAENSAAREQISCAAEAVVASDGDKKPAGFPSIEAPTRRQGIDVPAPSAASAANRTDNTRLFALEIGGATVLLAVAATLTGAGEAALLLGAIGLVADGVVRMSTDRGLLDWIVSRFRGPSS